MEVPYFIVLLIILVQSIGVLALLLGFLTRIAAAGNFIIMVGALFVHFKNDGSMNWYGKNGEGIEYFVLLLGVILVLIIDGGGLFSLDSMIKVFLNKYQFYF